MVENLEKQLIHLEQIINQTNEIDDVQTLDQTYEVNQLNFQINLFNNSLQELSTHLETIRSKLGLVLSSTDNRHLSKLNDIQQQLETIFIRVIFLSLKKNTFPHFMISSESTSTRYYSSNSC